MIALRLRTRAPMPPRAARRAPAAGPRARAAPRRGHGARRNNNNDDDDDDELDDDEVWRRADEVVSERPYVPEFEGVRVGAHSAAGTKHAANQDRWQFARSPAFGLWLALFDGGGLGGQRVAQRARQQLLPLCELGAPPPGAWAREEDLQASYDHHADRLLYAMQRGFVACEELLSARYARTHVSGGTTALTAAILELPPSPPGFPDSPPPPRRRAHRKLLLTWLGDAAALLRTRRSGGRAPVTRRLTPPRPFPGESDPETACAAIDVLPETLQLPLRPAHDALVLCSDGIIDVLSDKAIMAAAGAAWPHAELAARHVIEAAQAARARDDCTAIVVFFGTSDPA